MTECKTEEYEFHPLGNREVVGRFDGGDITTDAGGLLLREVEQRTGIIGRFAACFRDYRDPRFTEFTVEELVAQRVYGLGLGYEDLNDHDQLRADPALAVIVGKEDPKGEHRRVEQDRGKALAGKSTLNRLELTGAEAFCTDRYKKIGRDDDAIDRLFVDHFLESHKKPPLRIILDADAIDDPIHGNQEGRFFHGYYGHYCYLPLYIFCGEFLLCARLRRSDIDASAGVVDELKRIVAQIRTVRDRDGIYGRYFNERIQGMGTEQIFIAAQSPWQNCFVERMIGSIRRECLNHVVVINERHLRWILKRYIRYYLNSRTHLSLEKDAPEPRTIQPPELGKIVQLAEVGGLHHRYERRAA
ncbi:MAG: hypothetical protein DMG16_15435 [Acidobacteria bacterium]|nr:MAG: hypothetical protein DMG16_15435 [Acidobacteriota bacterium]